jgi:hypothetical protein
MEAKKGNTDSPNAFCRLTKYSMNTTRDRQSEKVPYFNLIPCYQFLVSKRSYVILRRIKRLQHTRVSHNPDQRSDVLSITPSSVISLLGTHPSPIACVEISLHKVVRQLSKSEVARILASFSSMVERPYEKGMHLSIFELAEGAELRILVNVDRMKRCGRVRCGTFRCPTAQR